MVHKPDIIGLSVTQRAAPATLKIVRQLREQGFLGHIVAGGYLPTLNAVDFLLKAKEVDSVVLGEGEQTTVELVDCLRSGRPWHNIAGLAYRNGSTVVTTPARPLIKHLDLLPFPARDLLNEALWRMGYATLISSRGCYGNCTFCPQNAYKMKNPGPRWRGRQPDLVAEEMRQMQVDFGVEMFKFNDDDIFGPGVKGRQRVIELCREIRQKKIKASLMCYCRINDIDREMLDVMRSAGFERILVGIESMDPQIIQHYQKGITPDQVYKKLALVEEMGFSIIPGFMMFNPYSSIPQLRSDLEFLRHTKSFGVSISKTLKVHDSTPIKDKLMEEGRLNEVPFDEGYHEYLVDNRVARIFKVLKLVWSKLIDPIQADYQHIATSLKKAKSFNQRQMFDEYHRLVWEIQADLLLNIIEWVEIDQIPPDQIEQTLTQVRQKMGSVIEFLQDQDKKYSKKKYGLYPFISIGCHQCLDLVSGRMAEIEESYFDELVEFVAKQSKKGLTKQFTNWFSKNYKMLNVGIFESVSKEVVSNQNIIINIEEILADRNLNSMTEKYFWK